MDYRLRVLDGQPVGQVLLDGPKCRTAAGIVDRPDERREQRVHHTAPRDHIRRGPNAENNEDFTT